MEMAGKGELTLLGLWASPFVIRVRFALNQKGLCYEYLEQDPRNKSEILIKYNPIYKKVPVLLHKGQPVCESLVILEYIDEVYSKIGPSMLPSDPYDRAVARFWASYIDDKLFPAWFGILKAKTEEAKAELIAQTIAGLELLEEAFKKCSKGKPYFSGDSIGYLDVTFGSYLGWFETVEQTNGIKLFDESKVPLLVEWQEHFRSMDGVKGVIQGLDKHVELAKMLQAQWNAASVN